MFSNNPANRKLNRKKRSRSSQRPRQDTLDSLRDKEYQLNAQIGELEEILASKEREEQERKTMHRENVLPPLEQRRIDHEPMIYTERRGRNKDSQGSFVYFLILLGIASALAFWLFYTGG